MLFHYTTQIKFLYPRTLRVTHNLKWKWLRPEKWLAIVSCQRLFLRKAAAVCKHFYLLKRDIDWEHQQYLVFFSVRALGKLLYHYVAPNYSIEERRLLCCFKHITLVITGNFAHQENYPFVFLWRVIWFESTAKYRASKRNDKYLIVIIKSLMRLLNRKWPVSCLISFLLGAVKPL